MIIIGIILAALLLFVAFAFAMWFVLKWVLIIGAVVIYGGCFLLFEAILGEGHEVTASGLTVMLGTGIIILMAKYSSFGEKSDKGNIVKKKDALFLDLISLSMIRKWAAPVKSGAHLSIIKKPIYGSIWTRLFTSKIEEFEIEAMVSNERHEVIDSCRWQVRRISTELAQQFGDSDRCSMRIERKPEENPEFGLTSALSWIKGKAAEFL